MTYFSARFEATRDFSYRHGAVLRARAQISPRLVAAADPHAILELPYAELVEQVDDLAREMLGYYDFRLTIFEIQDLARGLAEDLLKTTKKLLH